MLLRDLALIATYFCGAAAPQRIETEGNAINEPQALISAGLRPRSGLKRDRQNHSCGYHHFCGAAAPQRIETAACGW